MSDKTEKIGVLGAGTMGAGIAQVAAQAGFETLLYDIKQEFIDSGLGRIRSFLQGRSWTVCAAPQDWMISTEAR
jgi:3-hydroxybutyryl-CoA dehydrogenase